MYAHNLNRPNQLVRLDKLSIDLGSSLIRKIGFKISLSLILF